MNDLKQTVKSLGNTQLHKALVQLGRVERQCLVQILLHLHEVGRRKLFAHMGYSSLVDYCIQQLHMSEHQALKRGRVAELIHFYPELIPLLESGQTSLSALYMACSRITQANCNKLVEFLPGKSKRQVEAFLNRLMPDGQLLSDQAAAQVMVPIRISQKNLDKLRKVQSLVQRGKPATESIDALAMVLDEFLDRHDPMAKAKRMEAKLKAKTAAAKAAETKVKAEKNNQAERPEAGAQSQVQALSCAEAPGQKFLQNSSSEAPEQETVKQTTPLNTAANQDDSRVCRNTRYIPARIRHQIFIRDGGQCTFVDPEQGRCRETNNIEIDHIKPWSIGGEHSIDNLRLLCFRHNQRLAAKIGLMSRLGAGI